MRKRRKERGRRGRDELDEDPVERLVRVSVPVESEVDGGTAAE